MGIERHFSGDGHGSGVLHLQKESPSMGIESSTITALLRTKNPTCKKSPQAWGLKVAGAVFLLYLVAVLAKRVPKHGD